MKKEWVCYECCEKFSTRGKLIGHLKEELEEGMELVDGIVMQFEELGIENPYKLE